MAYMHRVRSSVRMSPDSILRRLLVAREQDIAGIVAPLSARERAGLAMFCYSRAHLHEIAFAVAATCDQYALMQAAPSNAAGHLIFMQSRERREPRERASNGSRPRITLARSASGNSGLADVIASVAREDALEPA
jgi:hypothetical protein